MIVKFPLKDEKDTYVFAWTTTPWTLPGNTALAVGTDIKYVKVAVDNEGKKENYIVAEDLVDAVLGDMEYEVKELLKAKAKIEGDTEPLVRYALDESEYVSLTQSPLLKPDLFFKLPHEQRLSIVRSMHDKGVLIAGLIEFATNSEHQSDKVPENELHEILSDFLQSESLQRDWRERSYANRLPSLTMYRILIWSRSKSNREMLNLRCGRRPWHSMMGKSKKRSMSISDSRLPT